MSVARPQNLVNMGCLHPVKIVTKTGDTMTVPCRRCAYCRLHHADLNSLFCSYELTDNPYNLFITLTYCNEDLPVVSFSYRPDNPHICDFYDKSTGEIFAPQYHNDKTIYFVKNLALNYAERFPKFFDSQTIPVLKISHAQLFLKRLRQKCFRRFKSYKMFRYFLCCEYGESSFRPHYHLLLFCQSDEVRSYIAQNFTSCWQYGRVDARYFRGSTANYLSSYCVGLCAGLNVFSAGPFKSQCRHSVRLGARFVQKTQGDFYKSFLLGSTLRQTCIIDGHEAPLMVTPFCKNTVYPKCRGFCGSDDRLLLSRYLLSLGDSRRCSEITRELVSEIIDYKKCPFSPYPRYFHNFPHSDILRTDDYNFIYNCVYRDVSVSRRFITAARLYSHNSFEIHLFKTLRYYFARSMRVFESDLSNFALLKSLGDDLALCYYLYDKQICFTSFDNYRKSKNFTAWSLYCHKRLYDCSKSKKQKEAYTLKPYYKSDSCISLS